jgi:hypothetical protein
MLLAAADMVDAVSEAVAASSGRLRPILVGLSAAAKLSLPKGLADLIDADNVGSAANDLRDKAGQAALKAAEAAKNVKLGVDGSDAGKWVDDVFAKIRAAMGDKGGVEVGVKVNPADIAALVAKFDQMRQAVALPMEAFAGKNNDIDAMRARGLFKGDPTLEARMRVQGFRDLGATVGGPQFGAAAMMGSREEYSALAAFRSENRKETVADVIRAAGERQERELQEVVRINAAVLAQLEAMAAAEEEDF